ncbi:MAG: GNAT family N-acetyltransferase [Pseudomonadota bacterium]
MAAATDLNIRQMADGEADALGRLMFRAIRAGASAYTPAQRTAWCAAPPAGAAWHAKLSKQAVRVAETHGVPVGLMTRAGAYIDLAYVLPDWQGRGVFSALYARLESEARAEACNRLWVHASLMAQPAFAAKGFRVIRHEMVPRAGQMLPRAEMEKDLT